MRSYTTLSRVLQWLLCSELQCVSRASLRADRGLLGCSIRARSIGAICGVGRSTVSFGSSCSKSCALSRLQAPVESARCCDTCRNTSISTGLVGLRAWWIIWNSWHAVSRSIPGSMSSSALNISCNRTKVFCVAVGAQGKGNRAGCASRRIITVILNSIRCALRYSRLL